MTEEVTNIISEELGIDKSNIYVSYYPTDKWGWNGNNF
jgi:phenylpyruvate tautomerase PptA (4-oxalocrotonate tautomerase family)